MTIPWAIPFILHLTVRLPGISVGRTVKIPPEGTAPVLCLRRFVIAVSKGLLFKGNKSITDVAIRCGILSDARCDLLLQPGCLLLERN